MSTWMAFGSILGTFWSHFRRLWAPVTKFSGRSAGLEKRQKTRSEKVTQEFPCEGGPLNNTQSWRLEAGGLEAGGSQKPEGATGHTSSAKARWRIMRGGVT